MASREGTRGGGGSQAGRRWPGRVAARATEQLRGEGEEDDRGRSGGGLAAGGAGPGGLRGERQVSFLSSLLYFYLILFSIFCSLF